MVVSGIEKNGYTYTGSPITVKSLALRRGKTTLKNGVDYTISYQNNVNIGNSAKVVVTGKGIFKGSASKTFVIKMAAPAKTSVSRLARARYIKLRRRACLAI